MHILLVSSNSSGTGGGERYLVYLANGLLVLGHRVTLLVSNAQYMDSIAASAVAEGVVVKRCPAIGLRDRRLRFVAALCDRNQIRRLAAQYAELSPDVIHVNQQYDEDGLDYLEAAARLAIPSVGTIHLPMCEGKLERPFGTIRSMLMKAWYSRRRYHKVFVSSASLEEFSAFYGPSIYHHCVPNGVPRPKTVNSPAGDKSWLPHPVRDWSASDVVLGFVGRIDDQKDPPLLFAAWLQVRITIPSCKLLVVGDGPMRNFFEESARVLGLETELHITGWVPEVGTWWDLISVVVMCSKFEGMSLALLESVVREKRVVTTVCNGVKEVVGIVPWLRVASSRDPIALSGEIRKALDVPILSSDQMSTICEYFSTRRMAGETLDVYVAAGACMGM